MRHVRLFIACLTGIAALCIATTTTAYATRLPDPGGVASTPPPPPHSVTSIWQFLAYGAVGVLLAVATVGLGYSLSHSRKQAPSTRSTRLRA
jgi:hypothetical protein